MLYLPSLSEELIDILPENIYNYDETNMTDDSGAKTDIVKRGHARQVERKLEHSKQSTSIKFAGNAAGMYLAPMIVYNAQNLYAGWANGGPAGTVYDVSNNGLVVVHLKFGSPKCSYLSLSLLPEQRF